MRLRRQHTTISAAAFNSYPVGPELCFNSLVQAFYVENGIKSVGRVANCEFHQPHRPEGILYCVGNSHTDDVQHWMKRLHVRIFEVSVHDEKECSNRNATNHHCDAGTTHNDAPQLPPLWLSVK